MEFQEREVTFKLKSRPLRCVYLIRNREDLLNAITLFTYTWGGGANAILPIPSNSEEIDNFRTTLEWMNPDYIFFPREDSSLNISRFLKNIPILTVPISKYEVEQHINILGGNNQVRLLRGSLSHIGVILSKIYQNSLDTSNLYLIDEGKTFNLEVALHLGLPSQFYRNYLTQHLAAKSFSHPLNIEQLLKQFLIATKFSNPYSLTFSKTRKSYDVNRYLIEANDEETLCLFLDDGKDLGLVTAFWNCRWIFPNNKILLPREEFLKEIKICVIQMIQFMPHIRALNVTTPYSSEDALNLYHKLKSTFKDAGREVLVKVNHQDFRFDWFPGTIYSGETGEFTRTITSEGCVRFDPYTPIGHEKTDFTFGYDAELTFVSGRRFFSPKTLTGSRLLTNELWRLKCLEENKDDLGELWLKRDLPVRTGVTGISGLASPGKECSLYIHSDSFVIAQHLKDVELELKPNQHTRYAQGLVKRFGGLDKVINLISDGGFDILSSLASRSTEARKSDQKNIISFLVKKRNLSQQDANQLIKQKLQPLLSSALIRRGYCLECPSCNLMNWFLLEEIREFLECKGCAEIFQLPLHGIQFAFEPNELANQLIKEGGLAVLMTAALLKRIPDSRSSFIEFGGDLFPIGKKVNTNEVDLFWLTEDALIIAECKSFFDLSTQRDEQKVEKRIDKIKDSLVKNLDLAKRIDAKAVLLGVATNLSEIPKLFTIVADLAQTAKDCGIGVHLVLNGKIHLMGSTNGVEPRNIRLNNLLIEEEILLSDGFVGESPNHYGGTVGSNGLFDKQIFKQWELELRQQ